MFGIFKKKKKNTYIKEVQFYLSEMGYDLLPMGVGIAALDQFHNRKSVETASYIALITLAQDVRNAWNDMEALAALAVHGRLLIDLLTYYKEQGLMHPLQWQNDVTAVFYVVYVDETQEEWLDAVLADPVCGHMKMAVSRLD
jgi:hypothetical protein